ncbi:MAG: stage II sporulation protein M [Planctomycetaceae bacterium]|nr:stage II sporulation protein M [Planctomycetaceae bacterium]
MTRERFIRQRRNDWRKFEELLLHLKSTRASKWSSGDVSDLARLYRSICYDLSLVQSREWGMRLERYLNDLVAQGHNCLYRTQPVSFKVVTRFLGVRFPQLLRHYHTAFFVAIALFVVPFVVCTWIGYQRPDLAELIAGKAATDEAIENFGTDKYTKFDEVYAGQRSMMAGFYIRNNIGIAFQAFALGMFFGIGTAWVLLSNAIATGMVTGYLWHHGGDAWLNFSSFVITHGAFELTAIVVSGAAGIVLGTSIVWPGQRTRRDSIRHRGKHALEITLGAGVMLLIAAMIEGFFSPMPIDPLIKYIAGTFAWVGVIAYLGLTGRGASPIAFDEETV